MGHPKNKYENQEINKVLKHQQNEIDNFKKLDMLKTEQNIRETEEMLSSLGIELPKEKGGKEKEESIKKVIRIPSWEDLVKEAESEIKENVSLKSLFTEEEIEKNRLALTKWEREFNAIHTLDKYDVAICAFAAIVGATIELLTIGIPVSSSNGVTTGSFSSYVRHWFEKKYPKEEIQKLENLSASKVPYDAQDNRHTTKYVEGLSSKYHRLYSIGHDPLIGFLVGTSDIKNGTMTTIDKNGKDNKVL